ncbi:hypothetical protein O3M35_000863 [Rhynocoris fuscipes]|uniref:Uncharacterized protein n=1 Tax=Rhynocoris fuscipes TaxID=488301 RepID=A0AAW1DSS2_9HEMI
MRIYLVMSLCLFCVNVYCNDNRDSPAFFDRVVEKCSSNHRLDKNEARKIISAVRRNAHTDDEKCMLSCYMKERGFFFNGRVNWDRIFVPVSLMLSSEQERKRTMEEFQNCDRKLGYGTRNDCEIAYDALVCYENVMLIN